MTPDTWRRLDEHCAEFPEARGSGAPVTSLEIDEASRALGVPFSEDYRHWLLRYGAAMVGAYPVFGLRPAPFMGRDWSVVEMTESFRRDEWPGTGEWAVISMDGFGNPIGLDAVGRVLRMDHDSEFELEVLAPNLEGFLRCWGLGLAE